MLAAAHSYTLDGLEARPVTVEVDVSRGLPAFSIVGLPDSAVREARERVRSALVNSGLDFPLRRVTANLAPAAVRKAGAGFDLALAIALLAAAGEVPREALETTAFCAELSLSGELRPLRGALALAGGAADGGRRRLVVAAPDGPEAALAEGVLVHAPATLAAVVEWLRGERELIPVEPSPVVGCERGSALDLSDVRGQPGAKRALEIAAAGPHNLLLVGPPGVGKTMLARRLPDLLPPPAHEEALEITRVQGAAGLGRGGLALERPYRAPHHTISASGLVGGGSVPRPGELTLAHLGVLFLDELPEFSRMALEALRQPLEEGWVMVNRGQRSVRYPARALLVAACNSCPCARPAGDCTCDLSALRRYASRLSGPLLDRIELVCELQRVPAGAAHSTAAETPPARARVKRAREIGPGSLAPAARRLLEEAAASAQLSERGRAGVTRVACTIAALGGRRRAGEDDVAEALSYRRPALHTALAA